MKFLFKLLTGLLSLTLILGLLFAYGIFIEPRLLHVDSVTIGTQYTQSNTGHTLTIVQFSDTHLGFHYDLAQLEEAANAINDLSPDIVVFTGDLMDNANTYPDIDRIAPILSQIQAPLGKFAVYGNHDYGGGAEWHYAEIMAAGGFTLLVNEVATVTLDDGTLLQIGGLDEVMLGHPDPQAVMAQFSPLAAQLLLLHEPDYISHFATLPHLALAGHSHGGQVQLPFLGPITHTAYGEKYVEGSYPLSENCLLYVNIGLGTTKLPIRFAAPPTITAFELTL